MPNVAFISPKGGAGKTTAALVLALGLAEQGLRVALIDSDPNKPLLRWAGLPGRPQSISVHVAPTIPDIRDAMNEARRLEPHWTIIDTEGTVRGAMVFAALRLDLVITPLTGSQLDVTEAIKAAEIVETFGKRGGAKLNHRCLLTRVPAALKPRSLQAVVQQLKDAEIDILPVALVEKEAFRDLFTGGGDLTSLEERDTYGVSAARENAAAYVAAVADALREAPAPIQEAPLTHAEQGFSERP